MSKLSKLWSRLRELNDTIRKRRRRGHKTPDLAAERKRIKKKIAWLKAHKDPKPKPVYKGQKWVPFDGHLVAAWMLNEALTPARESGVWKGVVFSGYRSPEYCRQLCQQDCGHDSCPGTCAGVTSNHCGPPSFKGVKYEGAVDVTDPEGLQRWCKAHGNPIHGNGEMLPLDHPHFSRSGR